MSATWRIKLGKEEQGVYGDRYTMIPRTLIFATREDEVLLIKGSANKRLWPNRYNGIGGHIEAGEDVLSAARREFLEETGVQLEAPRLCAVITVDTGQKAGIMIFVFRGMCGPGTIVSSGEGNLEWIETSQLHQFNLVEDLPILLPRVLAAEIGSPPIFAQYHYDEQDKLQITFK